MRSCSEINQEIFVTANRRQALWSAGIHHPDDLFAVRALEKRLADLYDEKREAMAGDQVRAKHRARVADPMAHDVRQPWELKTAPLGDGNRGGRLAQGQTRDALIHLERDAAAA